MLHLLLLQDGTDSAGSSSPQKDNILEDIVNDAINDTNETKQDNNGTHEEETSKPKEEVLSKVEIATTPSTELVSSDNCLVVRN